MRFFAFYSVEVTRHFKLKILRTGRDLFGYYFSSFYFILVHYIRSMKIFFLFFRRLDGTCSRVEPCVALRIFRGPQPGREGRCIKTATSRQTSTNLKDTNNEEHWFSARQSCNWFESCQVWALTLSLFYNVFLFSRWIWHNSMLMSCPQTMRRTHL